MGRAAIRSLHTRDVPVHLVERERTKCERLQPHCADVFCGDADEYACLKEAGIEEVPPVLLTTNDKAVNIPLASYCRTPPRCAW